MIAEIARGGMGIVYLAMVQGPGGFNKLVVVKELKPDLVEEPLYLQMFLDEARLAARLNHPNIVQTNDVGNDGIRHFMAMDYLDGRGLDRVRRRSQYSDHGLTLAMELRVICDVLAGLDYAHTFADFDGTMLGIVHRDVSPQNVFITFEGQVSLLDFGIAKTVDSMVETKAGVLKGKMSYMAPEQARGQPVDARADVFAAGVMLWEALVGRRLSYGLTENQMMETLVKGDLPRASTAKPGIPAELDEICARAMAFDRSKRYPSAAVFQEQLERYLAQTGTNVSAREVGTYVTTLFRDDRIKTKALIEAHIAHARSESTQDELPSIDISYSSPPLATPVEERTSQRMPVIEGQVSTPSSLSTGTGSRDATPAPRSRGVWVTVLLLFGALGAAAVYFLILRSDDEPAAAMVHTNPPNTATVTPEVEDAAVKPNLIDVEIRVTPADAILTIDGTTVTGNPFHDKYVGDGAMHQVRAEAPGYVTKAESVRFTSNVTLDLALDHEPAIAHPPIHGVAHGGGGHPSPHHGNTPGDHVDTPPDAANVAVKPPVEPTPEEKPKPKVDPNPYTRSE